MRNTKAHVKVVREWCVSLGILTAVSISRQEAEMKLAAYIPMLLQRFPDAAFTAESLEHVAAKAVKGFPTYGELATWLDEWWRPKRPPLIALAPPPPSPPAPEPTPEMLAYVRTRVEEVTALISARQRDDAEARHFGARHLSAGALDAINPLPNGRKRAAS